MSELIAGHSFVDGTNGRVCSCGRRWVDICGASDADLDQLHVAHTGALNHAELAQIHAERDRIWAALSDAASGGRS